MAWGNLLTADNVASDAATTAEATSHAPMFQLKPFDATLYEPMVKPVSAMPTITDDVPIVDQRERDREEVKAHLQSILRNRLLSETARVSAARELTRIFDNEEIAELYEEVKRLRAIIEANADESELPPMLRRGRR